MARFFLRDILLISQNPIDNAIFNLYVFICFSINIQAIEIFTKTISSLGINLLYINLDSDSKYGDYEVKGLGISPFLEFYFGNPSDCNVQGKIYPYGKIFADFLSGKIDQVEGSIMRMGLKGGMNIMITETTALDITAQYSLGSFKAKNGR